MWSGYVSYVGEDNFSFFRFLLPVIPALVMLFEHSRSGIRAGAGAGVRLGCSVALLVGFACCHVATYQTQADAYFGDQRLAEAWSKVGRWIEKETPSHSVIAAIIPGVLGYFGQRSMIDMLGLTDREVATAGQVFPHAAHGHARFNTDYISNHSPDVVLYHASDRFSKRMYANAGSILKEH